jgi:hypothetical protein
MLTAILAGVAFVVLFTAWVVLPSRIKKSRSSDEEDE